jgi:ribosome-binding protein aMBF1 (putative translation factor)
MKEPAMRKKKGQAAASSAVAGTLTIRGTEYVVLPRAEYLKQVGMVPPGSVEALSYVRASVAEGLRAARETAGLTQGELADKLGKSQTLVSQAEGGRERVGERYVASVLKACGLPKDWKPAKGTGVHP